jgi:hypothetical protein
MKYSLGIFLLAAAMTCGNTSAQTTQQVPEAAPDAAETANPATGPVVLEWTPTALATLSAQAAAKSSFTLDRSMLTAASSLLPDSDKETRQSIAKIDGVSVHLLRFGPAGIGDETAVDQIRAAYHLRGWKHLMSNSTGKDPLHSETTDLWLVMDGVNVRGAVILVETPKSLTLATLTGNLSPVDLLHLRGHFGIPRFDADGFKEAK